MQLIRASVGKGGHNFREDVILVQSLLKSKGYDLGRIDGICGDRTIRAIVSFQARIMVHSDGLIEPGHATWRKLESANPINQHPLSSAKLPVINGTPTPANLSNWSGDSSKWSQDKKIQSMNPLLRPKVQAVLAALTARKFQPMVFFGWRSVAVQLDLYKQGNTQVKFSFHNAQLKDGTPNSYAADIVDKRYAWSEAAKTSGFWKALGEEAKKQALYWGGDWMSFPDVAHVQLTENSALGRVKEESGL